MALEILRNVGSSMNPDKKVRRLQGLLYTSGVGTILFSIWSGIRGIESLFEIWKELPKEYGIELNSTVMNTILCLFIFLILMCSIFLYVYIGKTAMAVSCGEKKGNLYLVLSVLFNINSWALYVPQFVNGEVFEAKTMIYLMINLSSNTDTEGQAHTKFRFQLLPECTEGQAHAKFDKED